MAVKDLMFRITPRMKRWFSIMVIVFCCVGGGVLLIMKLIPALSGILNESSLNEVAAVLAIIISIIVMIINLVKDQFKYEYATKYTIKMHSNVSNNIVIITCVFKNESKNRILLRNFYLFIDSSIEPTGNCGCYRFDEILHHEEGKPDCELGKKCKGNTVLHEYPQEIIKPEYKNSYHDFYQLKHLSANSVTYIDPGESFSEDITMKLKEGVYRAILVGTAHNHDCMCANIQFTIQEIAIVNNGGA